MEDNNVNEETVQQEELDREQTPQEEEKPQARFTQEDVDAMIAKRFKREREAWEKKMEEAARVAKMDAEEKAQYDHEQLKKQLEHYQRKEHLQNMKDAARKTLSSEGVNVSDELLEGLVREDEEATLNAAQSFMKMYKIAVEDGIKAQMRAPVPRTVTPSKMTREEIMAIKDTAERQRAISENLELFGRR